MKLLAWLQSLLPSARRARADEYLGRLPEACENYLKAGLYEDAARLLERLGDDPTRTQNQRWLHHEQSLFLHGSKAGQEARRRLEAKILSLLLGSPVDSPEFLRRCDLLRSGGRLRELGEELERAGRFSEAMQAYAEDGCLDDLDRLEEHVDRARLEQRRLDEILHDLGRARSKHDRLEEWKLLREASTLSTPPAREMEALAKLEPRLLGPRILLRSEALVEPLELRISNSLTIGRDAEEADVCLEAPGVSRRHVRIYGFEGRLYIEDLHSRNGTLLDGLGLQGYVEVVDWVDVRLGGEASFRLRPVGSEGDGPAFELRGPAFPRPMLVLAGPFTLQSGERLRHPALSGAVLRLLPESGHLLVASCPGGPGIRLDHEELSPPWMPYRDETIRVNGVAFEFRRLEGR